MATRKYHRKPNTFRKARSKRQRGGNPDDQDEKDTYLFDAIGDHDYDKVEDALKKGANVNAEAGYINDGHAEAGYIDDDDKLTITPLRHAINSGDIDMVELLLNHADIDIKLDVKFNRELALAESLTPEDEDQNGIPYMIEDYIVTKIEEKERKEAPINEIKKIQRIMAKKSKNTIPSLSEMAAASLTPAQRQDIHRNSWNINERTGEVGGKRKTRKKNSRGRKTRKSRKIKFKKSKRKSKRH